MREQPVGFLDRLLAAKMPRRKRGSPAFSRAAKNMF
jgi:hypothetical protein